MIYIVPVGEETYSFYQRLMKKTKAIDEPLDYVKRYEFMEETGMTAPQTHAIDVTNFSDARFAFISLEKNIVYFSESDVCLGHPDRKKRVRYIEDIISHYKESDVLVGKMKISPIT